MVLLSKRDAFTLWELRLSMWEPLNNLLPNCKCERAHIAILVLGGYENPSEMRLWVQSAGELSIPVEVKVEDEGNLEWTVEEREGKSQF